MVSEPWAHHQGGLALTHNSYGSLIDISCPLIRGGSPSVGKRAGNLQSPSVGKLILQKSQCRESIVNISPSVRKLAPDDETRSGNEIRF